MAQVSEQDVLKALSGVVDEDKNRDIVSLGMVTGLQVKQGHVAFAIQVEPERGPRLEPLRKKAEQTVHALPGVLTATVVLTAERPASQASIAACPTSRCRDLASLTSSGRLAP